MAHENEGWGWFDLAPGNKARQRESERQQDLALSCARCFGSRDGQRVLAHLRAVTIDRTLGPTVDSATLRHMEGQRHLVSYLMTLMKRGQEGQSQ
ncbi:hypothetical protein JCM17960_17000 [Magnetospira thiophila]